MPSKPHRQKTGVARKPSAGAGARFYSAKMDAPDILETPPMHLVQIGTRIINLEHVSKATFTPNGNLLALQLGPVTAEFKGDEAIRLWDILKEACPPSGTLKK